MNILVYSSIIPYPLNEGGKTAQFSVLQEMVQQATVHFAAPVYNTQDAVWLQELQAALPALKVQGLTIEVKKDTRKNWLLRAVNKVHWHLGKLLAAFEPRKHPVLENAFFLNPAHQKPESLVTGFHRLCLELLPDVVQIDFIDNADMVYLVPPSVKKVLVLHDLRFATVAQAAGISNVSSIYARYVTDLVKQRELLYMQLFDCLLVFSEQDKIKLQQEGLSHIEVAPFATSNVPVKVPEQTDKYPGRLILLGPEHHEPNRDALQWFAANCYKKLYPECALQVEVVGEWSVAAQKNFAAFPRIHFRGFVKDLPAAMTEAIMIVPLRMGSGIRTKILDAFALGVPVVTTSVGVEGIPVIDGEHCLIADTPETFVAAIQRLAHDVPLLNQLRSHAFELVQEYYHVGRVSGRRLEIYRQLFSNNT